AAKANRARELRTALRIMKGAPVLHTPSITHENGARCHRAPSKLSSGRSRSDPKDLVFLLGQDLTAFVHAGLQVDVVRTTQFAGVLVFDIGVGAQGVMSATHVATRGGGFALRNGHVRL